MAYLGPAGVQNFAVWRKSKKFRCFVQKGVLTLFQDCREACQKKRLLAGQKRFSTEEKRFSSTSPIKKNMHHWESPHPAQALFQPKNTFFLKEHKTHTHTHTLEDPGMSGSHSCPMPAYWQYFFGRQQKTLSSVISHAGLILPLAFLIESTVDNRIMRTCIFVLIMR